jgi:hypothetical protein
MVRQCAMALSPTGKRQRLFFSTRLEAETECERPKTKKVNFGHSLVRCRQPGSLRLRRVTLDWTGKRPESPSPRRSTGFLIDTRQLTPAMSVLWERFVESRAEVDYQKDLATTFRRLGSLAKLMASDVTAEQIESSLVEFPTTYRNAALRYLRAAFNFGIPKWLKGKSRRPDRVYQGRETTASR